MAESQDLWAGLKAGWFPGPSGSRGYAAHPPTPCHRDSNPVQHGVGSAPSAEPRFCTRVRGLRQGGRSACRRWPAVAGVPDRTWLLHHGAERSAANGAA